MKDKLREQEMERLKSDAKVIIKMIYMRIRMGGQRELTSNNVFALFYPLFLFFFYTWTKA